METLGRQMRVAGDPEAGTPIETETQVIARLGVQLRDLATANNRIHEVETKIANLSTLSPVVQIVRLQSYIVEEGSIAHLAN